MYTDLTSTTTPEQCNAHFPLFLIILDIDYRSALGHHRVVPRFFWGYTYHKSQLQR